MPPPPSLIDRLLGNLPVFLSIWAVFIASALLWVAETGAVQYTPFVMGFVSLWAWGSRTRVVADQRWQREKDEVLGRDPRRAPKPLRIAIGIFYIALAVPMLFFGWQLTTGFVQSVYGVDIPAMFTGWTLPQSMETGGRGPALLAGMMALGAIAIMWRRRRRGAARRLPVKARAGEWDGTVKVVLPVPNDEG